MNLRDQPGIVGIGGLIDSLNWRLDERGALVKRLGYGLYTAGNIVNQASAVITELGIYEKTGASTKILAGCSNGKIQTSPDDGVWTDAFTMPSGARPTFCQLGGKAIIANGVDKPRSWDGSSAVTLSAAPTGHLMCVWRNRLWIVDEGTNKLSWSTILDPTDWPATNFVYIGGPSDAPITAITPAPNVGSNFEGADGVLVFSRRHTHRVYDDSDNATADPPTGGSSVLVDAGQGCIAPRSIAHVAGRVFLVGEPGILSTDGHSALRLESGALGAGFLSYATSLAQRTLMAGTQWQGNYLLAYPQLGTTANNRVLEVYTSLPHESGTDGHPIMALDMPAAAWCVYPATTGPKLYMVDAKSGDERYLRQAFFGGTDSSGSTAMVPISCAATSGFDELGYARRKVARQVRLTGRGTLSVSIASDLSYGIGDSASFPLAVSDDLWNDGELWNEGTWGPHGGQNEGVGWYSKEGRLFSIRVSEVGSSTASPRSRLGITPPAVGGAAVYDLVLRYTPLNCD